MKVSCFWYDADYILSTCTYSVGDALHTCECDGVVNECRWQEGGKPIAFEGSKDDN